MKKAVISLTVVTLVFALLSVGAYVVLAFLPTLLGAINAYITSAPEFLLAPFSVMGSWFNFAQFSSDLMGNLIPIVALCLLGVLVIIALIWFIVICVRKRWGSLLVLLTYLIAVFVSLYVTSGLCFVSNNSGQYTIISSVDALGTSLIWQMTTVGMLEDPTGIWYVVIAWAIAGLTLLFVLLMFITFIVDMVHISRSPAGEKRVYASSDDDRVVMVRDEPMNEGPSTQEIRELLHEELSSLDEGPSPKEKVEEKPAPQTVVNVPQSNTPAGISGPLLVQYINTYGPDNSRPQNVVPPYPYPPYGYPYPYPYPPYPEAPKAAPEAKVEPQKEEVKQPQVTSVEETKKVEEAKVEEKPSPNLNAIKEAMHNELEEVRLAKEEPVTVLPEPKEEMEAPRIINVGPSLDEIRAIIREELKNDEKAPVIVTVPSPAPIKEEVKESEPVQVTEPVVEEVKEEVKEPEPVQPSLTIDDIRQVIIEELEKRNVYHVVEEKRIVEEHVEPEVKEESAPVIEEIQPQTVVVETPIEKVEEPASEKPKIIRIAFEERMKDADQELKDHYNELKAEILSYGVNSRVSNSGDTFRLHRKTYVKMTIAGKSLKLYLALDPKDYENTTLPIQDAGDKGIYVDIPLVFKVKSDLSLRRAKQLIADTMEKDGLEQGKIEPYDWASELIKGIKK